MNSNDQNPTSTEEPTSAKGDQAEKPSRFASMFKRKKDTAVNTEPEATTSEPQQNTDPTPQATVEQGLEPSRKGILSKIGDVFKGTFDLNDELFEELEESLIASDLGVTASFTVVEQLQERVRTEKIKDQAGVIRGLSREIAELLKRAETDWPMTAQPYVILVVGVNGVGKTTTIAKLAHHFKQRGKSVMLAAGDTFRAAAVAQLQQWGQRLDIPVIAQGQGADAAAVAHDALTAAKSRNTDVLIIDTAGRLHTQTDLMEQLQKVKRVMAKIDENTPHEVMQILDAGTGQNALSQLEHFRKSVGVTSLCLTKLDGSARGGVAVSLTEKYKLPIRFIGVGEGINDLKPFNATEFAEGLLPS